MIVRIPEFALPQEFEVSAVGHSVGPLHSVRRRRRHHLKKHDQNWICRVRMTAPFSLTLASGEPADSLCVCVFWKQTVCAKNTPSDEKCCSAVIYSCIKNRLNNLSNALSGPLVIGVQSCSILSFSPSSDLIRIVGSTNRDTNHRWESESWREHKAYHFDLLYWYFLVCFFVEIFSFRLNRRLSSELL